MMILVRNSVIFFKKILQTYNYVYFITLKNKVIFVRPPLIKLAGSATTSNRPHRVTEDELTARLQAHDRTGDRGRHMPLRHTPV